MKELKVKRIPEDKILYVLRPSELDRLAARIADRYHCQAKEREVKK